MKIYKYHSFDSKSSINNISINNSNKYIAISDSNNQITILNYNHILSLYNSSQEKNQNRVNNSNNDFLNNNNNNQSYLFSPSLSIPKLFLTRHNSFISAIQFSNINPEILYSGSHDKTIIVWQINQNDFCAKILSTLQMKNEVTHISLYPDDKYLAVVCQDILYIYQINYENNTYILSTQYKLFSKVTYGFLFDPYNKNGKFCSLGDEGKLIIGNYQNNIINIEHIFADFGECFSLNNVAAYDKNNLNIKLDWGIEGKWIISVYHSKVKGRDQQNFMSLSHCRLICINDYSKNKILFGHNLPINLAKFSKCIYNDKAGNKFNMCLTADVGGKIIIWKIINDEFNILVEIENYSEDIINDAVWSGEGNYIFTVDNKGIFCGIEINEFHIVRYSERHYAMNSINNLDFKFNEGCDNNKSFYSSGNILIPLHIYTKDKKQINISYENFLQGNYSIIKMTIGKNIFYANKLNRLIKFFTANNYFYAYYDKNTINAHSLLNSKLIFNFYYENIEIIESYMNYLLLFTKSNRIIILNVYTQEKIIDEILNLNYSHTKIDEIYFNNLQNIFLKVYSFDTYSNSNNKYILTFSIKDKLLILNQQNNIDKNLSLNRNDDQMSFYFKYFEGVESNYVKNIFDLFNGENEYFNYSNNINDIWDNVVKNYYMKNKSEFLKSVEKLFNFVRMRNNNYFNYIIDDFMHLFGNKNDVKDDILKIKNK